jgi:hypothetical protein
MTERDDEFVLSSATSTAAQQRKRPAEQERQSRGDIAIAARAVAHKFECASKLTYTDPRAGLRATS